MLSYGRIYPAAPVSSKNANLWNAWPTSPLKKSFMQYEINYWGDVNRIVNLRHAALLKIFIVVGLFSISFSPDGDKKVDMAGITREERNWR
jgi:hypothetical protein